MKLTNATFTAQRGCLIEIDGWPADIETKPALLCDGVCHITALNAADRTKAEDLLISPCGQDGTVFGCNAPRLVELAARYWLWSQGDDFTEKSETVLSDPLAAAIMLQQHLAKLNLV